MYSFECILNWLLLLCLIVLGKVKYVKVFVGGVNVILVVLKDMLKY